MTTVTVTEAGASGRYIDLGSPSNQDDIGAQTIVIYCKPADQAANIGYIFAKGTSGGNGIRVIQNTSNRIAVGVDSSGGALAPSVISTNAITLSTWQHIEATWDGSLNSSGIAISVDGVSAGNGGGVVEGFGAITSDAANNVFLLNRTGLGRHVLGDVAWIARWNRVLNSTELTTVRNSGPLAVPSGLILCFANGQDYSTNAVSVSSRTTQVAGATPTNTALGDDTIISTSVGNAAANGVTASINSTVVISATPGNAVAAGITATISTANMALSISYERSSADLATSSISGTGDSAVISVKPKVQEWESAAFSTAWLEPSIEITGVNGYRPTFRFLNYLTGVDGYHTGTSGWQSTRRPSYSTDGGLTWTYFDTAPTLDTSNHWIEFRNSTSFTSDTIIVSRSRQINVHQVGDWMAAFAAAHSEFVPTDSAVAYTPSGSVSSFAAQAFIADEFSTQVDSLGVTVPVQPFYAGMINDTALMPLDGSAKRIAIVSCGVHAGEDYAHWSMRGFLNYLMGASAEAQALRRRYKVLVYPMVNAPGRAGGGWRGSWTQGTGGVDDPNRHFDNALGLEIVSKPKAAITTDIGSGTKDWAIDFHGTYQYDWEFICPYASSILNRLHSLQQTNSGETIVKTVSFQAGYLVTWLQDTMGFKFGTVVEHGDPNPHTDAEIEDYGASFVPSLATMAAEGAFGIIATPGNAVAAGITASVTTSLQNIITTTVGNAIANGTLATVRDASYRGNIFMSLLGVG